MVTIEMLDKLFTKVSGETLDALLSAMTTAGLANDLRVAARFCAQVGHESIGLTHSKEIGGEKTRYAPWFGRGFIQLTWKSNYEACAKATGLDCVNHPEVLEASDGAATSACWFYTSRGLHRLSNFDTISTRINGSGITEASKADRRAWYRRACAAFEITCDL